MDEYVYFEDDYEIIIEKSVNIDDEYSEIVSYGIYDGAGGSVAIHSSKRNISQK